VKLKGGVFLPNLVTMGNGICGFAAVVKLMKIHIGAQAPPGGDLVGHLFQKGGAIEVFLQDPGLVATAAWFILVGMVFDVFDGQVARLAGKTSDLGAQLDSLCDLVTFGLAPALVVVRLNMTQPRFLQNVAWCAALLYFLGAMLRLARFTVDNDPDESAHLRFKGLPSPAAAGCVASLAIFHDYVRRFEDSELHFLAGLFSKELIQQVAQWIPAALPLVAVILGWTMVSTRLKFDHLASQLIHRGLSFDVFVSIVFAGIIVYLLKEIALPVIFLGYVLYSPCRRLVGQLRRHPDEPERELEELNLRSGGPRER
jgi:CDP-diacylglycerol--serine O-phosphatidyltransferase